MQKHKCIHKLHLGNGNYMGACFQAPGAAPGQDKWKCTMFH